MEQESNKTPEQIFLDIDSEKDQFNSPQYSIFLDTLFSLGSIPEETYKIFDGLDVTLRILAPVENLEVAKKIDSCPGFSSREYVLKLETLARAVVKVNNQFLRFSESMVSEWQEFRNIVEKPTEIEQQRYIIQYRFKQFIIDEIFKKYQELLKKQEQVFADLKKN
mgnify:CR=1 FL=1